MATALPGRSAATAVSTDGVTYTTVGACKDAISWGITPETFDSTTRDDTAWKRKMTGRSQVDDVSFSGQYAEDDAGQTILMDVATVPTTRIYVRIRPSVGTGADQFVVSGFLAYKHDIPDDGPEMFTATISVDGAITKSDQP